MPTKKKPTRHIPQFRYEVNVYVGLNHEPAHSQTVDAPNRKQAEAEVLAMAQDRMVAIATRVEKESE
jgi:hypothetical protein